MRRPSLVATAALAAALVAGAPARAQQLPAAQHVPAAKTLGYAEFADLGKADAAFRQTDVGQAWQTVAPFFDALMKSVDAQMAEQKAQFEQQFGAKFDDAVAALKSGLAIAVVDMAPPGGEPQPVPLLMLAPSAKKTAQQIVDFQKRKAAQAGGQGGPPPLYFVDREGVVVVTPDQNAVAGKGDAATLDKDAQYQAVRGKVVGAGTPVLFVFANVAGLIERGTAGMPPEPKQQLDTAGALGVKASGLAISIDGGQTREAFFLSTAGEQKGALKILTSCTKPLELTKLAERAPAETLSFAAARFDLRSAFDQGVALAKALEPQGAKGIDEEVKRADADPELKLHADFLDPLGDLYTIESFQPDEGLLPETVFSLGVKDGAKVEATLAKIAAKAGFDVATLERGGHKIHYMKARLGQLGEDPFTQNRETGGMVSPAEQVLTALSGTLSSWTLDGDRLYLAGLPQTLEDRFERLAKGNLSTNEGFKAAAAKAQGARAFAWSNLRPTAGMVYHVLLKVLRAFEPAIRRAGVAVDTTLLPRPSGFARPIQPSTMAVFAESDGFLVQGRGGVPVLTVAPIVAAIAIPNLMKAKKGANEAAAIGAMRTLTTAQALFRDADKDGNGKPDYAASLEALGAVGFIDSVLASGMKQGYRFQIVKGDESAWSATAVPLAFGDSGDRSFFVDESGVIRFSIGEEPTAQSQPLD